MRIEHIGYQVSEPVRVAAWYVEHLGFRVMRKSDQSPWAHFLADDSGRVMIEIYSNPNAPMPDYAALDPLVLHLAFSTEDVERERQRLLAAWATADGEIELTPAGDHVAMLRDPWGFPIQLCKRSQPMV
jgi:catechol 2,3-dioxygenase-like lactoylglutathione lyase family enzyme